MEPNKLETQFKEKLNSREIKPTEMAWDRLDAMLTFAEGDKPKRKFTWLYIAASFIGFMWITSVFFNQKESPIDINKNTVLIEKTNPKENLKPEIKSEIKETVFSKTILNQGSKPLVQNQKKSNKKAENFIHKSQKSIVTEILHNNQDIIIAEKTSFIPDNIDSLLASVEKNKKSEVKNSSVKINSSDLLNQVDGELELSFREKALNTINKKFKEAKEALANRNNQ
jgi:hypothetical protein